MTGWEKIDGIGIRLFVWTDFYLALIESGTAYRAANGSD